MKKSIFDKLESKINWITETTGKYPSEITISPEDFIELYEYHVPGSDFSYMGVKLIVDESNK